MFLPRISILLWLLNFRFLNLFTLTLMIHTHYFKRLLKRDVSLLTTAWRSNFIKDKSEVMAYVVMVHGGHIYLLLSICCHQECLVLVMTRATYSSTTSNPSLRRGYWQKRMRVYGTLPLWVGNCCWSLLLWGCFIVIFDHW